MPEIIVALIHLAGDLLIGLLMLVGFGGVLIAWAIPALAHHPIATAIIVLIIAGLVKAHS
jgi:hypothetical protein